MVVLTNGGQNERYVNGIFDNKEKTLDNEEKCRGGASPAQVPPVLPHFL